MSRWRTTSRSNTAVRVIVGVGALFAFIELLYMVMVLAGANAGNGFFIFIQSLAGPLALFWPGLFPVNDPNFQVILDYGLAAAFWVILAGVIARIAAR
ncbi:hypothetical protein [Amycolatopsis regifaucium]|uniref:YggT family protein n=1 Tax=Amycolatopsis regifaucium TaxID=546365 RepID=A0A154M7C1_9PSEU|nr:hypothetical protein AVL48_14155 [Amycolatopsis regifaucium]OKA09668.1 hypothetical protein ATP06_0208395 [Amycolatopsis regifaucium]SFH62493.1 hypothetical protein SAMN04489731_105293 [Amycolatopsis regifaucium]